MRMPAHTPLYLFPAVAFVLALSSCTTDNTTDTLSTTTPGLWFTGEGLVKDDQKVNAFAALNFENLKHDMAQGRGEYLASLGTLLGVPRDHQAEFFALTQKKYPILVQSDRTTPGEMLAALNRELSANPILNETVVNN